MYIYRYISSFNKLFLYCILSNLKFFKISRNPHKKSHAGSRIEGFPICHQMMLLVALKIKQNCSFCTGSHFWWVWMKPRDGVMHRHHIFYDIFCMGITYFLLCTELSIKLWKLPITDHVVFITLCMELQIQDN